LITLYDIVIKPIEENLVEGDELIIVPDGPLWLAPFAAFTRASPDLPVSKYLLESFRIRVIPSLTSMKMLVDCPEEHHMRGALLVGNPCVQEVTDSKGNKLLEQLPRAEEEVKMIGKIIKKKTSYRKGCHEN